MQVVLLVVFISFVPVLVSQFPALAQTTTPFAPNAQLNRTVSPDTQPTGDLIQEDLTNWGGSRGTSAPSSKANATETQKSAKRVLRIVINVPYTKTSSVTKQFVTHFVAYPYPVQPPRMKKEITPLPTSDTKSGRMRLKALIQDASYNSRTIAERPYPFGGLRFKYAYQKALQKSGMTPPQTLLSVYPFVDQILPYVQAEVQKYNRLEDERLRRYKLAIKEFEENRTDIETEAMERGLFPVEIRMNKVERGLKAGQVELSQGTWWIIGTLRIPSLTYYWQLPVSVTSTGNEVVVIDQGNAMLIEGGW